MDYNSKFKEKLTKIIFIPVKARALTERISVSSKLMLSDEEILLPVGSKYILQDKDISEQIKTTYIIEGMYYVLGIDRSFRYGEIYKSLLKALEGADKYIKGIIAEEYKKENYEDAFIYSRGLLKLEQHRDVFTNAIIIAEALRAKEKSFDSIELELIEEYKSYYNDPYPCYIEALIYYSRGELLRAQGCISEYYSKGGAEEEIIEKLKNDIQENLDDKKALEYINKKPQESLKILLDRYEKGENNANILCYIAVAYRNLALHEKAIYYLNEALAIDSSFVDVVNELGINYAALGSYKVAVEYLRKAFESTMSIEICTNLALCYFYDNDIENAKAHIRIAEKLDASDEVLKKVKEIVFKEEN